MQMFKYINDFLNKTPMYKLVIIGLLTISVVAFGQSFIGLQPYTPTSLFISFVTSLVVCVSMNFISARYFKLPVQYESSIITGLIIFLILLPYDGTPTLVSIIVAGFVASISKYIFVYRNTHLFNPAAIGIFAVTLVNHFTDMGSAFWWVGSVYTLPIVLLVGILIVMKTKRYALFYSGLVAGLVGACASAYFHQLDVLSAINNVFVSGPIIFFLTVMVTEPHTIAKNRNQQIFYGMFVVLLPVFADAFQIMIIQPELSLLVANLLSFVASNRRRYVLKLDRVDKLSQNIYEYYFVNSDFHKRDQKFKFVPGEYLEWNLEHTQTDYRGTRRYFTVSSAPYMTHIAFATRFPDKDESSFKKVLKDLKPGDEIFATQVGGDFVLPRNKSKNLIMIAGGIGITPFISQFRDLLNRKEKRNLVLFCCVKTLQDAVYVDILKKSIVEFGIKVVCVVSDPKGISDHENLKVTVPNWFYESGFLTKEIIMKYSQNLNNEYYISGPNIMVEMLKKSLEEMKVNDKHIHTDYFPGY